VGKQRDRNWGKWADAGSSLIHVTAEGFRKWKWIVFVTLAISSMLSMFLPRVLFAGSLAVNVTAFFVWLWFTAQEPGDGVEFLRAQLDRCIAGEIGTVIDTLEVFDFNLHNAAIERLIELLPLAKAEHASLLTPARVEVLLKLLGYSQVPVVRRSIDRRLVLAILQAFENLGITSGRRSIARIAKRERDTAIKQVAIQCLATLDRIIAQEADRIKLLRTAHNCPQLLRPKTPTQCEVPNQHLPPTNRCEPEDQQVSGD
jgi:hypothetical protein